jgi:hypothetical protein
MAMLLGAEVAPKEINGVAGPIYILGGFDGGGWGTGFKVNLLVPAASKGGFEPP